MKRTLNMDIDERDSSNLTLQSSNHMTPLKVDRKENLKSNKNHPPNSNTFSWPSLWKNGPRRSAFLPYKPNIESASCSSSFSLNLATDMAPSASPLPRPSSSTIMTNLQRGNIQAEAAPTVTDFSWFTLAGRGDIMREQLQDMAAQGQDIDCVDDEGLSALMWAAYHGQIHTVQILLEGVEEEFGWEVEVDREGMWGETALMLAATEGHLEVVRLLISAGADINHEDHSHNTPLMCAVLGNHPHTVNELLIDGADLWAKNDSELTAYDIAIDEQFYESKAVLEKYMYSLLTGS